MSLVELERLAAERPPDTVEFFPPNDFYGHASILKRYCGLPGDFVLPAVQPHGPNLCDFVWDYEINHPWPNVLLHSPEQTPLYAKRCQKRLFVIGSPFYYAQRLIAAEVEELRKSAQGTIAFPLHSTHVVTRDYDQEAFIEYLKGLPEKYQPVEVCLYFRDIQLQRHRPFLEAGFSCTTAGHMFDKDFNLRLLRLLASHCWAAANEVSTSCLLAAALGLPNLLFLQKCDLAGANAKFLQDSGPKPELPIYQQFLRTVQLPIEQAAPIQRRLAEQALGYQSLLSSAELKALLQKMARHCPVKPPAPHPPQLLPHPKTRWQKFVTFCCPARTAQAEEIAAKLEQLRPLVVPTQLHRAWPLLAELKAYRRPIRELDFLRAEGFYHQGDVATAIEALKEELRYFPDNWVAAAKLAWLQSLCVTRPALGDPEFQELVQAVRPYTMLPDARLFSLYNLAREVCQQNIPGHFVQCGVAGGGSAAVLAAAIRRFSRQRRKLFAFDTFAGMPVPAPIEESQPPARVGWGTGTCAAPEKSVIQLCRKLDVRRFLRTRKGPFAKTLPRNRLGAIALLHADAGWYSSTKEIFEHLYDQLAPGARVQVDDCGYWPATRKALSDFETSRQLHWQRHLIDETCLWVAKPDAGRV